MSTLQLVFLIVTLGVIAVGFVLTLLRSREIRANGIEADAVVSRIEIETSADADSTTERVYVSYRTAEGQTVEALLGGIMLGRPSRKYSAGTPLRIQYLPEKPRYVLRVK